MSDKIESYRDRMQRKLTAAFAPTYLDIHDDSAKHAGHSGHNPLGETHFIVTVVSAAFKGLMPLARHRMVYAAVSDELVERVHALNIHAKTPEEYNHK